MSNERDLNPWRDDRPQNQGAVAWLLWLAVVAVPVAGLLLML